MNARLLVIIIGISIIATSCSSSQETEEAKIEQDQMISITHDQFQTDKMAFGELQKMPFTDIVKCNGNVVLKSRGIARVSPSVSGSVQKIFCTAGQIVKTGQVLFELSGNEFFDLQKSYAEAVSYLKKTKTEYERVKSLFEGNIGTEKELISAESEYKSAAANYSALKMKITFVGLDTSKVGDADFYHSFAIKSPINGYISNINVSLGQHADQQTVLAEIIDNKQLQLKLSVFEEAISQLDPGKKIKFKLSDNRYYNATLVSIGRSVSQESRAIECYASIDCIDSINFVNNAFAEAEIFIRTDTAYAVPKEAILKSERETFLLSFAKEEENSYFLNKVKVVLGRTNNGYEEVLSQHNISRILIKGVYNIQ